MAIRPRPDHQDPPSSRGHAPRLFVAWAHAGAFTGPRVLRRAFSLVELVLVLAILVVGAAIAAPRYGESIARYRVEGAARRIAADIALAQASARAASASRTINFSVDKNEYTITGVRALDGGAADYSVLLTDPPYQAYLSAAAFGDDAALTFDGFGVPDSAGSITVFVGRLARTVSVEAGTGATAIAVADPPPEAEREMIVGGKVKVLKD